MYRGMVAEYEHQSVQVQPRLQMPNFARQFICMRWDKS